MGNYSLLALALNSFGHRLPPDRNRTGFCLRKGPDGDESTGGPARRKPINDRADIWNQFPTERDKQCSAAAAMAPAPVSASPALLSSTSNYNLCGEPVRADPGKIKRWRNSVPAPRAWTAWRGS